MSDFGRSRSLEALNESPKTASPTAVCACGTMKGSSELLELGDDAAFPTSNGVRPPQRLLKRLKNRLTPTTGPAVVSESRRLAKEGISTAVVRIIGLGTAIAIDISAARLLSPDQAGIFFLLVSILSFCSVISMIGVSTAIVRFVSESMGLGNGGHARRALTLGLRLAALTIPLTTLACGIFMAAGGAHLLRLPFPSILVPLLLLNVLALPVLQVTSYTLRSFHETWLATLLTGQSGGPATNLLFLIAIALTALVVKPTAAGALTINAAAICLMIPLSLYVLGRVARSRLAAISDVRAEGTAPTLVLMLSVCLPVTLNQFFSYCTGFGDLWIAGSAVSHESFALYAAARRLMLLIGLPLQLVGLTIVASISELNAQGRLASLQRLLRDSATLAVIPALMALLALLAFGDRISSLVFGPYYAAAATPLRLMCLGQIVFVCAGSAELTLIMTGRQRIALFVNLGTTLTLAVGGTLGAKYFGITGLAAANAAVIAVQVSLFAFFARRSLGIWTVVDLIHVGPVLKRVLGMAAATHDEVATQ
jgi:O-antigen/teichoic acid export membrane protein